MMTELKMQGTENAKRRPLAGRRFKKSFGLRLLPVLLDARRAQPGEAVLVDGILPGEEFLDGQCVSGAGLFKREQTATNGCHHLRLTADDPALGTRCR